VAEAPLGESPYLILDARYKEVRLGGLVVSCTILVALGIGTTGKRSVLGVSASRSEAEVHWRAFLAWFQGPGLHGSAWSSSRPKPG
jgi:putative transposase